MNNIKRGEIYLARFDKKGTGSTDDKSSVQYGFRPVLIIQNDTGNDHSPTSIIAALTSKLDKADLPTHVHVTTECGLNKESLILLEQIATIDQFKLTHLIGALDDNKMKEVDRALALSVGISK